MSILAARRAMNLSSLRPQLAALSSGRLCLAASRQQQPQQFPAMRLAHNRSFGTALVSGTTFGDRTARGPLSIPQLNIVPAPRGQQTRGGRWESHTKADYGSRRGNTYRNNNNNSQQQRRLPLFSNITPESAVYLLIGVNGVMFLVWTTASQRFNSLGDKSMLTWLTRNCSTMWVNLAQGRIWTLVTPAFSHVDPMHLFVNMFVLYSFGTDVARMLGAKRFLGFYLGAAVVGNLVSAVIRGVVIPLRTGDMSSMVQPSIGASTSVIGITTLFACVYPMAQLQLFMIIPVRAWLATVGFVGWDLWRVMKHGSSKADGAGHLGGAAAGAAYYWFKLRPLIRRMR